MEEVKRVLESIIVELCFLAFGCGCLFCSVRGGRRIQFFPVRVQEIEEDVNVVLDSGGSKILSGVSARECQFQLI